MNSQPMNTNQVVLRPKTYGLAVASLVLSILGVLPVLPLIGSIAGIITGKIARTEILAHRDWYTGEAYAKAGVILGWIGVGLAVVAVISLTLFLLPMRSTITTGPAIQITVQP